VICNRMRRRIKTENIYSAIYRSISTRGGDSRGQGGKLPLLNNNVRRHRSMASGKYVDIHTKIFEICLPLANIYE